jgi:hypothetical protein
METSLRYSLKDTDWPDLSEDTRSARDLVWPAVVLMPRQWRTPSGSEFHLCQSQRAVRKIFLQSNVSSKVNIAGVIIYFC